MISVIRIDHRLLHGQVVFAWTKSQSIQRIILIDTEAAGNDFKKMSLRLSKPEGVKLSLFSVKDAIERIPKIKALKERTMLIFGNVSETYQFIEAYGPVPTINYGGVPDRPNATRYSNAVFLTDEEVKLSKEMNDMGISLEMQQVPTDPVQKLNSKLN